MSNSTRAQNLQVEANALFGKGDYSNAYLKYVEAIRSNNHDASLYVNRAACAIRLCMYAEAKDDAQKAVGLDPTHVKGWGRLAQACNGLRYYDESAECWRKALAALPAECPTALEQKLKEQCEAELKVVLERAARAADSVAKNQETKGKMPWDRANAIEDKLKAGMPESAGSSVWVMLRASKLWDDGVRGMMQFKVRPTPEGLQYGGCNGVLACLTNAVLTDSRVFHVDGPRWLEFYAKQVLLELSDFRTWPTRPVEEIKVEALKRQREKGRDAVCTAVHVTVCIWIMQGLVANRNQMDPQVALRRYDDVLELLEWGRTMSRRNVRTEEKAGMFEDYFVRGVRKLRLDALMAACGEHPSQGPEAPLQRLYDEARSIILEMPKVGSAALSDGKHEPGFILAFGVYPKACAYTMVGFYHQQMARRCARRMDFVGVSSHFLEGYQAYWEGAILFPQDDELRAWFLHVALHMLKTSGGEYPVVLHTLEQLRLTLPGVRKIWEHSKIAEQGRDKACEEDLQLEQKIVKDLADGKVKLEDRMLPEYFLSS
ncbi:hypothetical protein DAEQUDRAFT_766972 [Daedalea quercina L-15889]|uniref:Uncharacterized protein n=1 Tax=Daedalea quercina L-15889 TaxID=1314783 RepID=A0A165P0E9_9APHY|nr:hypothetical protein DAEQUDRAFT_766972 [Daedalea quercina L-15889]